MRFKRKPVVVEAMQWDGTLKGYYDIIVWLDELRPDLRVSLSMTDKKIEILNTGHRTPVTVHGLDWVILGSAYVYSTTDIVFKAMYEYEE